MTHFKDTIKKYMHPIQFSLIIMGIVLCYLNAKDTLEILLAFVVLPLNLIPAINLLFLQKQQGDTDSRQYLHQTASHYITNSLLVLFALMLPAHKSIKAILIVETFLFIAVEGVRHLIHSYHHQHVSQKRMHLLHFFLRGGLIVAVLPIILYFIA